MKIFSIRLLSTPALVSRQYIQTGKKMLEFRSYYERWLCKFSILKHGSRNQIIKSSSQRTLL